MPDPQDATGNLTGPLLTTDKLCKRYGDVTVLRDVSLTIRAGEIHALLGANGAGKSTFSKIISGLIASSGGSMQLAGNSFIPHNKQDSEANGIQIVQQELSLIPTLSIAENLFLANLPTKFGILDNRRLHADARKALDRFDLQELDTHTKVETLGVGHQQMIEIAAALAQRCRLLILDEPTAALSGKEAAHLFKHLKRLRNEGVGIIYISHRLAEISELSDQVTVLRDGKQVSTQPTDSITTDQMVDLMSGTQPTNSEEHTSYCSQEPALRVRSLCTAVIHDVSFEVYRGERLGITGLVGSGRTELLRAIFGADTATAGQIFLQSSDRPQRFQHPSQATAAGLAMVTEDRKQNGLLLPKSISINTTLCSMQRKFSRFGLIQQSAEIAVAEEMRAQLDTRCDSIYQAVGTLSGGNQQKVAIAKWLVRDAELFLFDEPTRGIDVAARRRIYRLFETLAADQKGLVIVSSDFEELSATCDRIAVMSKGRLVAIFKRGEWTQENIMQASFSEYLK
ncbi:Ribose import ATP-binding protein RbsA [Roseimaritima multifibrata]|uniref:Ribose import ATP-binding protein RbsA n=1 Tax=Roseimaritima multifibrata TaxID=1930274 RepID=A0A517MHJ6_9BACT|nr:sugar ABC transporter ATP-binding protein [Roseimaritima multifibrata]QDS94351.1 Ribose import ATP-binding protein RbsA [Roseimaritima multifibrata]